MTISHFVVGLIIGSYLQRKITSFSQCPPSDMSKETVYHGRQDDVQSV